MLHRRKIAATGAAIAALSAFTAFRPPSTPGPIERDFEAYYAAGATVNAGRDPYSRAIWDAQRRIPGVDTARDELLPFVGPAAALPLWSLLARLPYPGAVAAWTVVLVAALGGIVVAALRMASAPRDPWVIGLAAGAALASAPVIGGIALGQAALAAAAGVACAAAAYRSRWAAAAFVSTVIAALQPNLAFALIARVRSRWDLRVAGAAAGTFAILTLAAGGGPAGFLTYLQRLAAHGHAESGVAIQHTPAAIAYAFGLPQAALPAFGAAVALVSAAAAVTIVVSERLDATSATLVACALLPLAIPFFHEPDFALEVLPVLILAIRATGRARMLAAVAAVLVLVDWFGFAQRQQAAGQIACLGLAVACAFVGLKRSLTPLRVGDATGIIALALLAAVAIPLGLRHAAPTWPDMLPTGYRAPASGDTSSVWHDEQRAAGLTARDPAWGVLRGFPLAGCIVLTGALVADARRRRRVSAVRAAARVEPAAKPAG